MAAQFVAMSGTVTAIYPIVFALYGVLVLPTAVIGGTIGGAVSVIFKPPTVSVPSHAQRKRLS